MLELLVKDSVVKMLIEVKEQYIFNADKIGDYEKGVIDGIAESIRCVTFSTSKFNN